MHFLCSKVGHVQLDNGDDFDDKRLVGMICERLRPVALELHFDRVAYSVALEILNKVGKSEAQI